MKDCLDIQNYFHPFISFHILVGEHQNSLGSDHLLGQSRLFVVFAHGRPNKDRSQNEIRSSFTHLQH